MYVVTELGRLNHVLQQLKFKAGRVCVDILTLHVLVPVSLRGA